MSAVIQRCMLGLGVLMAFAPGRVLAQVQLVVVTLALSGSGPERCNGIDDNCNGLIDEGNPDGGYSCDTGELGICGPGIAQCINADIVCVRVLEPTSDANCNGLDEDCDGTADEHFVSTQTTCGVGACATNTGQLFCQGGSPVDTCDPFASAAADDTTCDGIDDDCNGVTDEGFVSAATACGIGACVSTGSTSCLGGSVVDSCSPNAPAADDSVCNGVDDDCDGSTDEEFTPAATNCGVGACGSTGVTSCVGGAVQDSCAPSAPAADDASCDGIDDDCDGITDEDYSSGATVCGTGACASTGSTSCVGGSVQDSCTPGTAAADDSACDGIDNDCDGGVDEDFVTSATSCGVGACGSIGSTSCVGGSVQDSCTPGAPAADDSVCNNIDDDCDGAVDEDFVSTATICGVGACSGATGVTSCVNGVVVDSCVPGPPGAGDTVCNGIDDDCDGLTDEDFVPRATVCGVGACFSTGVSSCVGGAVADSCTPGTAAAGDTTCDGVDDDCDGVNDEDFVSTTTTCGVGACASVGATSCVAGAVLNSCTPGSPAADDAACDGIDNDCNGSVDEDYVSTNTSCGVGPCASTGSTSCASGVVLDSCAPTSPAADDSVCNGIDDDCDGATDEEYLPVATVCGLGACAGNSGITSCVAGAVLNSCNPLLGAGAELCDGVDNNCNGTVDDEPEATATCLTADPCIGNEACLAGTCVSDTCVLDVDPDGIIGDGDFALFAACFGACYSPADSCIVTNFDGDADGCVGTGDFSGFAGCFRKICVDCANCFPAASGGRSSWGRAKQSVETSVQLVAVSEPTSGDFVDTLPESAAFFELRNRFHLEVWASRGEVREVTNDGLAAVFVALSYDPSLLVVEEIIPADLFGLLSVGTERGGGLISPVGGLAPLGMETVALSTEWVRVATVIMQVVGAGRTIIVASPTGGVRGISILDRFGDLDESRIEFGQVGLKFGRRSVGSLNKRQRHDGSTR